MAAMTDLKGTELGSQTVRIEHGPVRVFAIAVTDRRDEYAASDTVVPPTFPFSWSYWGHLDGAPRGLPIDTLRGPGRMILHGEQEFVYHRWPKVGDTVIGTARVSDVYERQTPSALMEFYVTETSWADAATGDAVCDVRFTLIVRDTTQKG